jgi:hypothetical protein
VGFLKVRDFPKKKKSPEEKEAPKIPKSWGDKVGLNKAAGPSRYQTIRRNFKGPRFGLQSVTF